MAKFAGSSLLLAARPAVLSFAPAIFEFAMAGLCQGVRSSFAICSRLVFMHIARQTHSFQFSCILHFSLLYL